MAKNQTGPAPEIAIIDDFELVRNGEGQWLLVLPDMRDESHDPLILSSGAELIGDDLFLSDSEGRTALQSLIAPHYAKAMRSDKPAFLHVCVVDDDGNNRFLSQIPFKC